MSLIQYNKSPCEDLSRVHALSSRMVDTDESSAEESEEFIEVNLCHQDFQEGIVHDVQIHVSHVMCSNHVL